MKIVKCEICSKNFPVSGRNGLKNHLKNHHKITDVKEYYDNFFGKKTCQNCKGEVRFKSVTGGYNKFCGARCINLDRASKGNYATKYDEIIKNKVIPEYLDGASKRSLSKKYKIKTDTISSYFDKFNVVTRERRLDLNIEEIYRDYKDNKKTLRNIANENGCSEHVVRRRFIENGLELFMHVGQSMGEVKVSEKLDSMGVKYLSNDRKTIRSLKNKNYMSELDFIIEGAMVAIEVNSTFTHCNKPVKYHSHKTEEALKSGLSLIHIWDYKDTNKQMLMLESKILGYSNSVGARECEVVFDGEFKKFFDDNHLDGDVNNKFSVGLKYRGELVCCISMRGHREGLEIARFASKLSFGVHHGFSRLMKYVKIEARKQGYSNIVTYADIDWTPDHLRSVYSLYGMRYEGKTPEKLIYTDGRNVFPRQKFMKHKLPSLLPEVYDNKLKANEMLSMVKIYPIYKTGNHKFSLSV